MSRNTFPCQYTSHISMPRNDTSMNELRIFPFLCLQGPHSHVYKGHNPTSTRATVQCQQGPHSQVTFPCLQKPQSHVYKGHNPTSTRAMSTRVTVQCQQGPHSQVTFLCHIPTSTRAIFPCLQGPQSHVYKDHIPMPIRVTFPRLLSTRVTFQCQVIQFWIQNITPPPLTSLTKTSLLLLYSDIP